MSVYHFKHCDVVVSKRRQQVQTVFHDGRMVLACPNHDPDSIQRARGLGYEGTDEQAVWEMTRWHDLLHTLIAEAQGEPWSPTLHAVAHDDYQLAPGVVEREERLVLLVQRLLAAGAGAVLSRSDRGQASGVKATVYTDAVA